MKILKTIVDLRRELDASFSKNKKVGFVPTMGALHEGHISLVKKSLSENEITVVSIFVNPIQFNNPEDLKKYPRIPEKDFEMLEKAKVDYVFFPDEKEIYPEKNTDKYDFGLLESVMEGEFRPGHFNGVAVVVRRLFEIVKPDNAYFGEKDFQQLAIIKKLVEDYKIPINIVPCPIIREPDGLAMSSRNMRLNMEERNSAKEIYRILLKASDMIQNTNFRALEDFVIAEINKIPLLKVEYFQIVDSQTLQQVNNFDDSESITGCAAVFAGNIRLIDNIRLK